ncbi:putative allatostatin B receptor, partial [Daphnia pulex]
YLVPVVFGLIFVSGVVGNGSLMFIICRYKSMRNLPNLFVFNLALGDLFILLFAVPFTSSIYTFDLWPFGELVCKASEFAKDTSVSVSVFTLTALSFDRYNVIVNPVQSYVAGPKLKRRIIFTLAAIWLASLGLASPSAVFSRLIAVKLLQTWNSSTVLLVRFCYPFPGKFGVDIHSKSVIVGRVLIQYLIPLAIIGTFYTITTRNLLRKYKFLTYLANNNRESRRKVAVMVQCFVGLFAVCFLPIHVYSLWFHFDPRSKTRYNQYWHSFRIFGFVLAYINSCINPIALYFISTNFRKHFKRLLFCGWGISDSITSDGRS